MRRPLVPHQINHQTNSSPQLAFSGFGILSYTIQHIASVIKGEAFLTHPAQQIEHLLTDSRKLVFPASSLFFALTTSRKSGNAYIKELSDKGVTSFIVKQGFDVSAYLNLNFIIVESPLKALQQLPAYHRQQFNIPVIGITGSNGKTIVKEWLYQLLHNDYNIVRSPKSYNSQIGVPLSVWQMNATNTLAIFEAGISEPGEMEALEEIIRPTIGVITNIGEAHSAGFTNNKQKAAEKFVLFNNAQTIIYNADDSIISNLASQHQAAKLSWGLSATALRITTIRKMVNNTYISATYNDEPVQTHIPFTDDASIANAITCWSVLLYLQVSSDEIIKRMVSLRAVEMRLQLKRAINNCYLINDSYSNDLSSLNIALDFLQQQSGNLSTTLILSDIADANADMLYERVAQSIALHHVTRFIGIGPQLQKHRLFFDVLLKESHYFNSAEDFKAHFPFSHFKDEVILLKGARSFAFEQINLLFEHKVHQTVMEVNLNAMVHNLKQYQQLLKPTTKVMAMVKAFSYGSGSAEIANVLQYHKVDYLAVAYADEGVELRKAGINMPILVMNPEEVTFDSVIEYNLEPELYSFHILTAFNQYLDNQGIPQFPVHVKIDTGMHRLGFESDELDDLADELRQVKRLVIKSVFSHLVASDEQQHDDFTQFQTDLFIKACNKIEVAIGYTFLKHIANSAAIFRHPQMQFNMVRLGIGLYGIDNSENAGLQLQTVATLKSTIAQIREVNAGETIGYSRKGILERDALIATVRIGYADGFSRRLGNGVGSMYVKNALAPVVGNVCMDMTMIDITHIPKVQEGDEVEIFGPHISIQQLATWSNTIPYETMTGISQRVKRVYYEE